MAVLCYCLDSRWGDSMGWKSGLVGLAVGVVGGRLGWWVGHCLLSDYKQQYQTMELQSARRSFQTQVLLSHFV